MAAAQESRASRRPPAWQPTLLLCFVGIVLPNALTLGALAAGIGTPPRTSAIAAYAVLALLARRLPFAATASLFLVIAAFDAVSTVALLFGLAPQEIMGALDLAHEIEFHHSPFYLSLGLALAALVVANLAALRLAPTRLQAGSGAALTVAALAFASFDILANSSPHYRFGTMAAVGQPMDSAAASSGFRQAALAGKRPVLVLVVEALGQFSDPARQEILLAPFRDPDLARRYQVTTGSSSYFGSTTAGELRELCLTREPYGSIEGARPDCLPAQLAARGYRTTAIHNFTSHFFHRTEWYPRIGFEKLVFGEDLAPALPRTCGGAFKGACDTDVIPSVVRAMRPGRRPAFTYWLTLSTHVPVRSIDGTPRLDCEARGGRIGHVEVCHMTELWLDLFDGLVAATAAMPSAEILIVGDHAPPLWSRSGRVLFEPGRVTWIRLSPLPGADKPPPRPDATAEAR